jgi:cellulose synthase/poly-beta-1,6-N-acetylglucosamine synthase-like glycosyltransferase
MFRRSAVVEAGGFASDTVGEDMELVVRLHRHCRDAGRPYRVRFMPDPVAWTEVPESLGQLGRQRDRWQRGLMESLHRHRGMVLNPRYGRIGLVALPYYYFLEMWGPVIEALGYLVFVPSVLMGAVSAAYVAAFLALSVVFGVALSLAAVGLEEHVFHRYTRTRDLLRLFLFAVVENFGYRQLSTFWRFRGVVSKVRNVRSWGEMERKGFQATGAEA